MLAGLSLSLPLEDRSFGIRLRSEVEIEPADPLQQPPVCAKVKNKEKERVDGKASGMSRIF